MVPLIYSVFRKVLRDIEFADYHIPKGWQVVIISNFITLQSINALLFLIKFIFLKYLTNILLIHMQIFWVSNMTHMDDSTFPDPSKFDPSRFENQASIPPYYYIPFGGGPRKCPGYEL